MNIHFHMIIFLFSVPLPVPLTLLSLSHSSIQHLPSLPLFFSLSFLASPFAPSSCESKSQVCLWPRFRIKAVLLVQKSHPRMHAVLNFALWPAALQNQKSQLLEGPFFPVSFHCECCCTPWSLQEGCMSEARFPTRPRIRLVLSVWEWVLHRSKALPLLTTLCFCQVFCFTTYLCILEHNVLGLIQGFYFPNNFLCVWSWCQLKFQVVEFIVQML